jgi:ferredoxin-NADP reductase
MIYLHLSARTSTVMRAYSLYDHMQNKMSPVAVKRISQHSRLLQETYYIPEKRDPVINRA